MSYIPKYTSYNKLARKLRGRLKVYETEELDIYPGQEPTQSADPDLVLDVLEETENLVDLILSQIYILPLQNTHPIVTDIVESLTISNIIKIHFQGQGFSSLSGDMSGMSPDTRNQAYTLLGMLTAGFNIYIPNVPQQNIIPGTMPPRRIILPGEAFVKDPQQQIPVRNETVISKLTVDITPENNPFDEHFRGDTRTWMPEF